MTFLSNRIADYPSVSQGKTRIPGVNDSEDAIFTDVSRMNKNLNKNSKISFEWRFLEFRAKSLLSRLNFIYFRSTTTYISFLL